MGPSEKYLTSKALNALWGMENSVRLKRMTRPAAWQPSRALIQSCSYEMLLRVSGVGPKTAELIMKWKQEG